MSSKQKTHIRTIDRYQSLLLRVILRPHLLLHWGGITAVKSIIINHLYTNLQACCKTVQREERASVTRKAEERKCRFSTQIVSSDVNKMPYVPTFPEHDEHHETSWRCFYYSQHRSLPVPNNESKTVTETNRGRWRQAVANVTANLKAGWSRHVLSYSQEQRLLNFTLLFVTGCEISARLRISRFGLLE